MKSIIFLLVLVISVVNSEDTEELVTPLEAPVGFSESGHYGINYATRKSYFRRNIDPQVNATGHKAACESFGLSILHLDTREEALFFLSVMRNDIGFQDHRWVGAFQDIGQWIWTSTNERIDYIFPWATGYPVIAPGNCLTLNKNGFLNSAACTSNQLYFCQRVGA